MGPQTDRKAAGTSVPQSVSLNALSQRTVVVIPPIEIGPARVIRMTLVGHPDDLRTVLVQTPDGISIDVRSIRDGIVTTPTRLSKRQREALRSAWEVGYYEIPRRNGIETVAGDLSCAVSTASDGGYRSGPSFPHEEPGRLTAGRLLDASIGDDTPYELLRRAESRLVANSLDAES